MTLCKVCRKAFTNPKGLSSAINQGGVAEGRHHNSLAKIQAAASEGCHACATIALRVTNPAAKKFHFTIMLTEESGDAHLKLQLFYSVEDSDENPDEDSDESVVFSLYEFKEDLRSLLYDGPDPGPNTASPQTWAQITSWMQTCQSHHPACQPPRQEPALKPTRLLLVSKDANAVYLRERDEIPVNTPYATLSHCWGGLVPITLTVAALPDRKAGIAMSALSTTFRHAVEVTRRLGLSYIWIDSLCIIQDSKADWAAESVRMQAVYSSAIVDIAATASSDGHGGLFRDRDARAALLPCQVQMWTGGHLVHHYLCDFEPWQEAFQHAPLNVRAWVLQERLLAPRVLHFDAEQVVWECDSLVACERYPKGFAKPLSEPEGMRINRVGSEGSRKGTGVFDIWGPIVSAYSSCAITMDTDRLIALYGVAMKVRDILDSKYIAGMWENDLVAQLTWMVANSDKSHRTKQHVAPSWSWACIVGEVIPFALDETVEEQRGGGDICKILDIQNGDPGQSEADVVFISHDELKIQCYLIPFMIIPVSGDYWDGKIPGEDGISEAYGKLHIEDEDDDDDDDVNDDDGDDGDLDDDDLDADDLDDDDSPSVEEFEAPWVTLYKHSSGEHYQLYLERDMDVNTEWAFTTHEERWLMPTRTCLGASGIRGLILERRPEDGGKFRRCGTFEYSFNEQVRNVWNCFLDFANGESDKAESLERCQGHGVLKPDLGSDARKHRKSKRVFKYTREDVGQFVITLM